MDVRPAAVRSADHSAAALASILHSITPNQRFQRKTVCEKLIAAIKEDHGDRNTLVQNLVDAFFVDEPPAVHKLVASNVKFTDVLLLFALREHPIPQQPRSQSERLSPPKHIARNFRDFADAMYDTETEASCRLRAEYLLCPAVAHVQREQRESQPAHPVITIYPEFELQVRLEHPKTHQQYLATGKADWVASYGTRGDASDGSVLYCVEAKQRSTFSKAEAQLLCYLAMCRHLRQNRINCSVQGFVTDGTRYCFYRITNDGVVHKSKVLETSDPTDLVTIYSWVVEQLRTVPHISPTTSPVKGSATDKVEVARRYEQDFFDPPLPTIAPCEIIDEDEDDPDAVMVY